MGSFSTEGDDNILIVLEEGRDVKKLHRCVIAVKEK
jgi:hypothetical protein